MRKWMSKNKKHKYNASVMNNNYNLISGEHSETDKNMWKLKLYLILINMFTVIILFINIIINELCKNATNF